MSYGLIYTVPFATLDNVPCVVEIEKEYYTGKSKELTPAGDSPFTVDIEDEEFLYTPTRFSTATIRVVGSDYLQNLFSTGYQMYRVTLKVDGLVTWCGFIKPELYTQDYTLKTFNLDLECISAMSTLEFIDYKQIGESRTFVSFWDLLKKCITSASAQYNAIYFPHVYAKDTESYAEGTNVLENMTVSEQNFFDEDDKAMTLKEVLEEICKFLNWTCVDWKGELYFIDIDHIGEFYKYDPITFKKNGTVSPTLLNIQNVGFAGSDHALDILPGYNKVTVKCSNYPIEEIKITEDFDKLKLLSNIGEVSTNLGNGNTRHTQREVLYPNILTMHQFTYKNGVLSPVTDLSIYKNKSNAAELLGAIPLRYASYESGLKTPTTQSYNYECAIQVRQRCGTKYDPINDITPNSVFNDSTVVISAKNEALFFGKGGALSLNMSIKVLQKDKYDSPFGGGIVPSEDGITYLKDMVKVGIRIGDKYVSKDDYGRFPWSDTPATMSISLDQSNVENADGKMGTGFVPLYKTYGVLGKYSDADGVVIYIPTNIYGTLELSIYAPTLTEREGQVPYGYLIKDLKLKYCSPIDINDNENSDRTYENVVNENYINELDEIEFKISSYNNDGACHSKVIWDDDYLTDNLYLAIEGTTVRPEEQLIRRIIKRYSAPRIKLTQVIKHTSDLTPLSRLSDNYMVNKRFINAGGTIDYKMNRFECIMIEV